MHKLEDSKEGVFDFILSKTLAPGEEGWVQRDKPHMQCKKEKIKTWGGPEKDKLCCIRAPPRGGRDWNLENPSPAKPMPKGNLEGGMDGFSNPSQVLVEHQHSLIIARKGPHWISSLFNENKRTYLIFVAYATHGVGVRFLAVT